MRRILVTGGEGQLGSALARACWPTGYEAVPLSRGSLDLADPDSIVRAVSGRPWAAVINAGACTAVDAAEGEGVRAWQVNALGPAALAAACRAAAIPIIQVSTDYVFDGCKAGAWEVDDPVAPLNVYGASKLGGELAVRTGCERHVIVRTSWLVSATGSNFVRTMLRVGADREEVRVVADQRGSPTSADDLAAALAIIAVRLAEDPAAPTGTFHFSNTGPTTWYGFAQAIFAGAAARGIASPVVSAATTAEYPTVARRPANSLLSIGALTQAYGIVPRDWRDALDDILDDLIGAGA